MIADISRLEDIINYQFKNKSLIITALTHSSFANENKHKNMEHNERLEFLGDAVLELVSSDFIFNSMDKMPEGEMTKLRASLVCEPTLAMDARELTLNQYIYLGKGEEQNGGRNRDSIVSDAFEAVIGAIYLDGGIKPASDFILKYALNDIESKRLFYDSKTILQERINTLGNCKLEYRIIDEKGPDHDKTYVASAYLDDKCIGTGEGHTKKAAQQQAAYMALKEMDKRK